MIRELKNINKVPPGGYIFVTDKPEKIILEDYTLLRLVKRVSNHYKINNLTLPANLPSIIQQQMCATLPPEHCKNVSEGVGDTVYKLTTATGIKALAHRKHKSSGVCKGCAARQSRLNKLLPYRR